MQAGKGVKPLEKTLGFEAGEGKFKIRLVVHETDGHGLCCVVTGGELVHIGGVAACYRNEGGSFTVDEISFPTHKDAFLAKQLAQRMHEATGQDAVVAVGIHVDRASSEDIECLCDNAFAATKKYIKTCKSTGETGTTPYCET